jgi:hypothetical protein
MRAQLNEQSRRAAMLAIEEKKEAHQAKEALRTLKAKLIHIKTALAASEPRRPPKMTQLAREAQIAPSWPPAKDDPYELIDAPQFADLAELVRPSGIMWPPPPPPIDAPCFTMSPGATAWFLDHAREDIPTPPGAASSAAIDSASEAADAKPATSMYAADAKPAKRPSQATVALFERMRAATEQAQQILRQAAKVQTLPSAEAEAQASPSQSEFSHEPQLTAEELTEKAEKLSRTELQALAKARGIRANQKSRVIIVQLVALAETSGD